MASWPDTHKAPGLVFARQGTGAHGGVPVGALCHPGMVGATALPLLDSQGCGPDYPGVAQHTDRNTIEGTRPLACGSQVVCWAPGPWCGPRRPPHTKLSAVAS